MNLNPQILFLALICGLAYTSFNFGEKHMGMSETDPLTGALILHVIALVVATLAFATASISKGTTLSLSSIQLGWTTLAGVSVAILDICLVLAYFKGAPMGAFIGVVQIMAVVFGGIIGMLWLGEEYSKVQIGGIVAGVLAMGMILFGGDTPAEAQVIDDSVSPTAEHTEELASQETIQ